MLHRNFTPMSLSMVIMAIFLFAAAPPLGLVLVLAAVGIGANKRRIAGEDYERRLFEAREKVRADKLRAARALARL
jgi:hypothetical protein